MFSFSGMDLPQVNQTVIDEVALRFPGVDAAVSAASTAVLSPGDVLFIPSFWGHLVFALGSEAPASASGGISYNVWFSSQSTLSFLTSHQHLSRALNQDLNSMLEPNWPKESVIAAARTLLKQVAKEAGHPQYAQELFNEQYRPLVHTAPQMDPLDEGRFCSSYPGDMKKAKQAGKGARKVLKHLKTVAVSHLLGALHGEIATLLLRNGFLTQDTEVRPSTDVIQFMRSLFECSA
eukprot:gnl/TRDRNA2_/TRDRNA2_135763_c1_seq2.p1 gnl/TRDRNA2_/TRDRNA2_135763_c1~~gnl/TRDRNA2_/TRDRNA2_135763_c1_seq2.p1  ORF type:complete len:235 (+),score=29.46 gnl/TRDRNA2_/TRDRNA2_135763_c1_seq2:291-995(+)